MLILITTLGILSYNIENNKQLSAKLGLTVVIDAGHGGIDAGAVGKKTGCKESDINLMISKKLQSLLKKANVNVVMTRQNKDGLYKTFGKKYKLEDMEARKKIIEENSPDLVVSIHQNSFSSNSAQGANIYYYDQSQLSKSVANVVSSEISKIPECKKSEIKTGDFYMLCCTKAPSILVECGFLSNTEEELLLSTNSYQERIAYSIYCGIAKYFEFIAY